VAGVVHPDFNIMLTTTPREYIGRTVTLRAGFHMRLRPIGNRISDIKLIESEIHRYKKVGNARGLALGNFITMPDMIDRMTAVGYTNEQTLSYIAERGGLSQRLPLGYDH
jgi:hypothetical protein